MDSKTNRYLAPLELLLYIVWLNVSFPFKLLFGSSLKKKISNPKNWAMSKKGNIYYQIRKDFVVIIYPYNEDEKERADNIFDHFKLLIKKDGDDYYVNNKFEDEEQAIENAYSALKQLKLA